jgi:hypothetical protein
MSGFAPDVALDTLFRRNATARPDSRALLDIDGAALSYAEMTTAVAGVAEQIASLNLAPRSSIALLLPNGRELAIALLAVLRSGHVAVPMPVAWRKSDLVRACREAEVAALITTTNFEAEGLPQLAAEVAIEVFELSFPCAFGNSLPDGIVPFSLSTYDNCAIVNAPISATVAPGIGTLEPASRGLRFVHHQDEELLAAGLGAMLASDVQSGDRIVSAVSLTTFAGLAAAFVPWLLSGGTLTLLSDLPGKGALAFDSRTHLVAAEGALASLCALDTTPIASAFAVHFAGTGPRGAYPVMNAATVADVITLGEIAAIALPRTTRDTTAPLPPAAIHAGNAGSGSPVIAETRIENGRIEIRGAIVPKGIEGSQEWLDTGFGAEPSAAGAFYVNAPDTLVCIGALRFDYADLERRIRSAALVSSVDVVSHPVLGSKIVISSERPEDTSRALLDAGLPRIIAASVRKADAVRAKAS